MIRFFLFWFLFAAVANAQEPVQALDARANDAYRAGDFDSAFTLWNRALAESADQPEAERGRLAYNAGNAAYRAGRTLEAVAWYTAALRLLPGDADGWANLELARTEAELEPADRGDLTDTFKRLVSSTTRAEAEWLALAGMVLLAVCLAGEALRGGMLWRRLSLGALVLFGFLALPWIWSAVHSGSRPMMVVETRSTPARSEPRADAKRLFDIPAGSEVEHLDELPGWVKIDAGEDRLVWVREGTVFDLAR
ncbi:MAG: tetratricopeptide repeat protein [bacterium]|nr:tetratricopeptide repeat protein [bacterium]